MFDVINLILAFLIFFIFFLGAVFFSKKETLMSTYFVFGVGAILYFSLIPIEFWLKASQYIWIGGVSVEISKYTPYILLQTVLSLVAFTVGLYLGKFKFRPLGTIDGVLLKEPFDKLSALLSLLLFSLFLFFYKDSLIQSSQNYFNTANLQYFNPIYSLLKYVLLLNLCVIGLCQLFNKRRFLGLMMVSIPFVFGIITNDKDPMLISAITGAIYIASRIRKPRAAAFFLLLSIPIISCLLFLIRFFSIFRAGIGFEDSYKAALSDFSFSRIDPGGPFLSILNSYSTNTFLYGKSYIDNLFLLVPKALNPSRNADLSEAFAKEMITDWVEGRGLAFSPLAEAYLNFGSFSFFHFLIVGILWAVFWNVIRRLWRHGLPAEGFSIFYKVYGFYFLVTSFRGTSLHFIKILPMYVLAGLILIFLINIFRKRK